ncbi:hypothetical protein L596_023787 [Steinernema carpocapsae]|uniref:T-box domain-containing protein n=1 Tax=Steinernema carpocapsae TaxID=34508 RepID=A0A4U5MEY2_STECR|nr:hypothetical protein L596_023787 [Steinernema carpocapsae]
MFYGYSDNFGHPLPPQDFSEPKFTTQSSGPLNDFRAEPEIDVTIKELDRWEAFHKLVNEMIVAKNGRNPFPIFDFDVGGLDREANYQIAIAFERCDEKRYTHQDGKWTNHGRGEPFGQPTLVFHHKEIQSGRQWMREGVRFHKIRFTNNVKSAQCHHTVLLLSMHKYIPVIYVYRVVNPMIQDLLVARLSFSSMEFIAVTAYQNGALKDLKVEFNPFAKAFRKDGKHTTKRSAEKRNEENEVDEADLPKKHKFEADTSDPFSSAFPQSFVPSTYPNLQPSLQYDQNQYSSWNPGYYYPNPNPQMQFMPSANFGFDNPSYNNYDPNQMYPNPHLPFPNSQNDSPYGSSC